MALSGEKTWAIPFAVPEQPGQFQVEAWVTSQPVAFRGSAGLEVRP